MLQRTSPTREVIANNLVAPPSRQLRARIASSFVARTTWRCTVSCEMPRIAAKSVPGFRQTPTTDLRHSSFGSDNGFFHETGSTIGAKTRQRSGARNTAAARRASVANLPFAATSSRALEATKCRRQKRSGGRTVHES